MSCIRQQGGHRFGGTEEVNRMRRGRGLLLVLSVDEFESFEKVRLKEDANRSEGGEVEH